MKTSAFSTCAAAIASLIVMTTGLLPAEPASGAGTETNTASSWSFTPDPELPNVLIIGDSISIGYTLQVRELLQEKANLFRPMGTRGNRRENCGGTTYGVENIDRWLAVSKWDVIHFNWGLHDLKHVKEAGGNEKSNDPDDPTQATIEKYTSNMRLLVEKLKGTGARLVFATTTPVVPATLNPLRDPLAPIHYNNAALEVMKENGIRINDLHRYCLPHLKDWQKQRNVHLHPQGSDALATEVARYISEELEAGKEEG